MVQHGAGLLNQAPSSSYRGQSGCLWRERRSAVRHGKAQALELWGLLRSHFRLLLLGLPCRLRTAIALFCWQLKWLTAAC